MGQKKLAQNTLRVNLSVEHTFWTRDVQALANILTNGNKSLLVRQLLEAEMERVTREGSAVRERAKRQQSEPEKVRGKSFGELFLKP